MGVVQDGFVTAVGYAKTWAYYGWIPATFYLGQYSALST